MARHLTFIAGTFSNPDKNSLIAIRLDIGANLSKTLITGVILRYPTPNPSFLENPVRIAKITATTYCSG
ncbi:MAG: hypothetical protein ACE5OZ_24875 [Candidatus Heimdallarchaeota archaeon]